MRDGTRAKKYVESNKEAWKICEYKKRPGQNERLTKKESAGNVKEELN